MSDLFRPFLDQQGFLVIDGALATELEGRGADLSGGLWSARILDENPELIRAVHLDYLRAGADCIISASYQATIEGFMERGKTEIEAIALLQQSVDLCCEARELFMAEAGSRQERPRPIVAASIGPYGAALADGSEYTGDYDLDEEGLVDFHSRRFEILAASRADLLACETIPSGVETHALHSVLSRHENVRAWVSFSCRNDDELVDGTPLVEAIASIEDLPQVLALGINCTPPHLILPLIERAREVTNKKLIVYPNSGETWDAETQCWRSVPASSTLAHQAGSWLRAGASLIGGCCRTTPSDIRDLRRQLLGSMPQTTDHV